MRRLFSILIGLLLILIGILGIVWRTELPNGVFAAIRLGALRLWPVLVFIVGAFFVLPPLLMRDRPGLSGLFIPGIPILVTGGLLLLASLTDRWGFIWGRFWPLEILAVALAFLLMALFLRKIGLTFPAVILAFNGLALQFTALTGWWEAWAILWIIEPLAVGVALLVLYFKLRKRGLLIAGLILCGIALLGVLLMSLILANRWWVLGLFGPALLVLLGGFFIIRALRVGKEVPVASIVSEEVIAPAEA
ncbi:MAG: hypothetical protein JW892_03260 [Anaerolineae bacterium]|nr:hypothetical protein [Anaerolineae bacterium]